MFTIANNEQLDLGGLGHDIATIDAIQERAKSLFKERRVKVAKTTVIASKLFCKCYSYFVL